MKIATLTERIAKCEKKIESKRNTIAKKTAWIEKKQKQNETADAMTRRENEFDIKWWTEDIRRIESEIKESENTLEKYRKQLAGEIERERTLIKEIPETLHRMRDELVERWDKYDADWQEHLRKCYKEMSSREFFDAFRRSGYEFMYKTAKEIHESNVRDAEDEIINLLYRVRDHVGQITDWSHIELSGGVLNGYVTGTEGRVEVETIGAGGYNIQRYHLRVLVKKIS